jgi:hypothetical protein
MKTLLVLQVHDELVLEVPEAELELVREMLPKLMGGVAKLKVPLLVEVGAVPHITDATELFCLSIGSKTVDARGIDPSIARGVNPKATTVRTAKTLPCIAAGTFFCQVVWLAAITTDSTMPISSADRINATGCLDIPQTIAVAPNVKAPNTMCKSKR